MESFLEHQRKGKRGVVDQNSNDLEFPLEKNGLSVVVHTVFILALVQSPQLKECSCSGG
jgi:hypothetical protein